MREEMLLSQARVIAWTISHMHVPVYIEIDDLISEAYVAFLNKIKYFDPERARLSTFARHVTFNHTCNYITKHKNKYKKAALSKNLEYCVDPRHELTLVQKDEIRRVRQYIHSWKCPTERTIWLSLLKGLSRAEICEKLEIKEAWYQKKKKKGLIRLKKYLKVGEEVCPV